MAVAFDFSTLMTRLNCSIGELEGTGFPLSKPLVCDPKCSLENCLKKMSLRGLRACLVHWPNGKTSFGVANLIVDSKSETFSRKLNIAEAAAGFDESEFESHIKSEYAILDMRDVVRICVDRYYETAAKSSSKEKIIPEMIQNVLQTEVGCIANISGRNNFKIATLNNTLQELVKRFFTSTRVPIFEALKNNKNPALMGVFSVSDLLLYLQKLTPKPQDFLSRCNSEFHSVSQDPLTAFPRKKSPTALDAWTAGQIKAVANFSKEATPSELFVGYEGESLIETLIALAKTGVSALPIVSKANPTKCLGVFSVRDLQFLLLNANALELQDCTLLKPVMNFICTIHQLDISKARYPVIHLRESATIDAVIGKILASNVRRIMLSNDYGSLTGILSISDVGRFIASELSKQ